MADAQPASSAAQDSSAAAQAESAAAVRRLRAAAELIATGSTPECPICLEQPSAMDARILRCCAAVMCRECVPLCNGICPFCRRELAGIGESCSHDDAERTARQLEARRFRAPSETSPDLSRTVYMNSTRASARASPGPRRRASRPTRTPRASTARQTTTPPPSTTLRTQPSRRQTTTPPPATTPAPRTTRRRRRRPRCHAHFPASTGPPCREEGTKRRAQGRVSRPPVPTPLPHAQVDYSATREYTPSVDYAAVGQRYTSSEPSPQG